MEWKFDNDRPIYLQIVEQMMIGIASGELKAGEKLASVRDLAVCAGVNPNTMQKALSELEGTGLVYSNRTSGRFVTEDADKIKRVKTEIAKKEVKKFLERAELLGLGKKDIFDLMNEIGGKE